MSALDLSARTARRELGALVEPADDHDLIAAFARAGQSLTFSCGRPRSPARCGRCSSSRVTASRVLSCSLSGPPLRSRPSWRSRPAD